MHIILAVLGVLGVIAYFVIRANQVNQAGRELLDTASEVKGFVRRSSWRRKTEVDPTREIDDPRVAAAVMMCAVANADGELTDRERQTVLALIGENFEMDPADCEEMLAQARWLAKEAKDLSAFLQRLSRPVADQCTAGEQRDLIAMLEAVDAVEGGGSEIVADALNALKQRLALT